MSAQLAVSGDCVQTLPDLPQTIVNRAACTDTYTRLVAQGRQDAAGLYHWLLTHTLGTCGFGGYRLPRLSLQEMALAGFAPGALWYLYRVNLFDFPNGTSPATVYSRCGYNGVIREIRGQLQGPNGNRLG